MELTTLLDPERVFATLPAASKKQVLQELAKRAAAATGKPQRVIFDALLARERLGTTGVGGGAAIPHGTVPGLERLIGLFARLTNPVDFDAPDDQPVDMVFLLLAPETSGASHLKALARIARLLRDQAACQKMRACDDPRELFALLTNKVPSLTH
jgi:PTS system nitrogen regulatory IIA component